MDGDSSPSLPDFKAHALCATLEPPSLVCASHTASQTLLMGKGLPWRLHGRIKAPISPSPGNVSTLSQPFNNYSLNKNENQKGVFLINSQCFVHTLSGVVLGPPASESPGVQVKMQKIP